MKKLGILATHPIQYHAPLFRELARREGVDLTVYFCYQPSAAEQGAGFGVAFDWDVDLTSGYRHVFLQNTAKNKSVGFCGYDVPEIAEIIREEMFDLFIVHGWAWKCCWQAFRACWKTGTRLGVRSDSQLPQCEPSNLIQKTKATLKKLIYPLFIKRFDVCLPYGQRSAEYFKYFGGQKIMIAPHFVDNNFFSSRVKTFSPQRSEFRKNWNVSKDAFCFMFCGKFQRKKRPMDILKASKILNDELRTKRQELGTIHLLMVGDGELRGKCEQYVKEHNLPVTFAGFMNQGEIAKAYAISDCLVLASDFTETWGLVVNEAMACGLPVIVSNSCGCAPDLLREETGMGFDCGDVEELAECMKMMMGFEDYSSVRIRQFIGEMYRASQAGKIIGEQV
jgi:glycosyltransferase involved in cell wall biosynthesis